MRTVNANGEMGKKDHRSVPQQKPQYPSGQPVEESTDAPLSEEIQMLGIPPATSGMAPQPPEDFMRPRGAAPYPTNRVFLGRPWSFWIMALLALFVGGALAYCLLC